MNREPAHPKVVLQIDNLESYYGPIMAIRGVSLKVHEGQIVTVLGANGAGKTTLLKTISGVMSPEKGRIQMDGSDIHALEPDAIVRRGILQVPEGRPRVRQLRTYIRVGYRLAGPRAKRR